MSNHYFGEDVDFWKWASFLNTKGYPVSSRTLDWVIGQDNVLKECDISLREWVEKIKWLESVGHFDHFKLKNVLQSLKGKLLGKKILERKVPAGPFILLLGDAGTGKSLLGQALADVLSDLYKEHDIPMDNIVCIKNKRVPSNPKIAIIPTKECFSSVIKLEKKQDRFSKFKGKFVKGIILLLGGLGLATLSIGLGMTFIPSIFGPLLGFNEYVVEGFIEVPIGLRFLAYLNIIVLGGSLLLLAVMGFVFSKMLSGVTGGTNIGNVQSSNMIKVLVDNTLEKAPFIDGTGARPSSLFGDIAWDPYQTGGLGTPEHQRVSAGLVHQAHKGILYIDEIKNLTGESVVDLLTALEDGQFAITLRGHSTQSGTAAMNVKTDSAPCMFLFVGAGNLDSVPLLHPALKDRFYGYGKIILMNNDMKNTIENRRRYVQFIAQEVKRFHLLPFTREACIEVIEEARRRTDRKGFLTCKFRPLIGIIKTASTLATMEGREEVFPYHVKEAIEEHCKTIEAQVLGRFIEEQRQLKEVKNEGVELGRVNALTVSEDPYSKERVGSVAVVKASMAKCIKDVKGSFTITGLAGDILKESSQKVRQVILKRYGVDISQQYITHIDFAQSYGVDGPSAGVTMAIAIASLLEGKPVRQDVAVTGEINITEEDAIPITAVGGLYEKLKAAEKWGMKKAIIPLRNYEYSISTTDYKINIVGASYLEDYLEECLVKGDTI